MKKFGFHLQRLLDYRNIVEERLLGELAAVRAEQEREKNRLMQTCTLVMSCRKAVRQRLTEGDSEGIRETFLYLHELNEQVRRQEEALKRIEEIRELKTAQVLKASRERKALEQLRDRKRNEHKAEVLREEQIFLDDIASARHKPTAAVGG